MSENNLNRKRSHSFSTENYSNTNKKVCCVGNEELLDFDSLEYAADRLLQEMDLGAESMQLQMELSLPAASPNFLISSTLFDDDYPLLFTDLEVSATETSCLDTTDYSESLTDTRTQDSNISETPNDKMPSKPRGYISAFNFFVVSKRPLLLSENPKLCCSNNTLNKMLGEIWKSLSSTEKHIFVQQANEDKQRYLIEVALYNKIAGNKKIIPRINPPPGLNLNGVEQDSGLMDEQSICSDQTKIKRPLRAYGLFAQQEKQFILGLKCKDLQKRMGRYFGIRWKLMDPSEKALYLELEEIQKL